MLAAHALPRVLSIFFGHAREKWHEAVLCTCLCGFELGNHVVGAGEGALA